MNIRVPAARRLGCLLSVLAAALALAVAAEARTARIALTVSGDETMGKDLQELVETFQKDQPLDGDSLAVLQGAQAAVGRVDAALRSRGFYGATTVATLGGRPVDDPSALDALEGRPDGEPLTVDVKVETGPRFRIDALAVRGVDGQASPPIDMSRIGLAQGDPADAAAILAAQSKVTDQFRQDGYALASIKREVVVDHATQGAEVTFIVTPGPIARLGPVTITGTDKVDAAFLQRRVPFKEGEVYSPAKVEALRGKITSLGTFNSVSVIPARQLDANGELPIEVRVTDRPPRSIGFGVSYETQLGFAVNGFWTHRNLFGQAESLRLTGEINHIGQGLAIQDTGFAFRADFRKPDFLRPEQDLRASAEAVRAVLPAYYRNAIGGSVGLDRIISPIWTVRAGIAGETSRERYISYSVWRYYDLIGVPMTALMNAANSDLDPTRGWRLQFDATPYFDIGPNSDFFAILRATGRAYFDLAEPGRTVLATRASFGSEPSTNVANIPPSKLFYAGGGGSVRGFVYQSAGPRDAFNNPLGGASVVEANLELRQRFGQALGAVAFVDAGSAYPGMLPNFSQLPPRVGVGLGARYYTDFGPIRLDVGVPLNKQNGDPSFTLYVSLGQSF
ncbi:MAG: BamA/TamA family outer membrane protein [Reyranellaceae bacterium]